MVTAILREYSRGGRELQNLRIEKEVLKQSVKDMVIKAVKKPKMLSKMAD